MIETVRRLEFPKGAIFTKDSDYWVRKTKDGGFEVGRKGDTEPLKQLSGDKDAQDLHRKMLILLYLQNRAERDPKAEVRREEHEGEEITAIYPDDDAHWMTKNMADTNCYAAAAFVANPDEKELKYLNYAGFTDDFPTPTQKSLSDLTDELKNSIPAFVIGIRGRMYKKRGLVARAHNFIAFEEDASSGDIICFEKVEINAPVRLIPLRKIYERYASDADFLWSSASLR